MGNPVKPAFNGLGTGGRVKASGLDKIKTFLIRYKFLNLLLLPGLLYFLIFHYLPLYGLIIAFKDYNGMGGFQGILNSPWVGFTHFQNFFGSYYFWRLLNNTLVISLYRLIWAFPAPIILALLINEITSSKIKRAIQTITYMPHFLSWVVISGLMVMMLNTSGPVNAIITGFGGQPISFLSDSRFFRSVLIGSSIWQGIGWGSIVYLAAIAGVPAELYESAIIDGANRWQRALHITLPSISFVIVILLILRVGQIINENFEQIFNLYSPAVYEVADVFDTFVYRKGIMNSDFAYSTAVGLFKSVTSLVLVLLTNKIAKMLGREGLW